MQWRPQWTIHGLLSLGNTSIIHLPRLELADKVLHLWAHNDGFIHHERNNLVEPLATSGTFIQNTAVMLWKMAGKTTLASLSSTFKSACCLTLVSSSVLSAFVKILVKHLVSRVLFACALTTPQAFGADARFWRLHDELRGQKLLDLLQHVPLHLQSHVVHVMVQAVVHDRVLKHQHDVSLELSCGANQAGLNVLFDGGQVHGPDGAKSREVWVMWSSFVAPGRQIRTQHFYLCTMLWYPGAISSVTGCKNTFAYLQQVQVEGHASVTTHFKQTSGWASVANVAVRNAWPVIGCSSPHQHNGFLPDLVSL